MHLRCPGNLVERIPPVIKRATVQVTVPDTEYFPEIIEAISVVEMPHLRIIEAPELPMIPRGVPVIRVTDTAIDLHRATVAGVKTMYFNVCGNRLTDEHHDFLVYAARMVHSNAMDIIIQHTVGGQSTVIHLDRPVPENPEDPIIKWPKPIAHIYEFDGKRQRSRADSQNVIDILCEIGFAVKWYGNNKGEQYEHVKECIPVTGYPRRAHKIHPSPYVHINGAAAWQIISGQSFAYSSGALGERRGVETGTHNAVMSQECKRRRHGECS